MATDMGSSMHRKRLINKPLPVASSLDTLASIRALKQQLSLTGDFCDGMDKCSEGDDDSTCPHTDRVPAPLFACEEALFRKASNRRLKLQESTILANRAVLAYPTKRFPAVVLRSRTMKEYLRCAPSLPEYITCAPKPSLPKDKIKCEYCNKIVLGLELHQSYNKKCKQQQDLVNARRAQEQAEQALVEEESWFVARDNMAPSARFVRPLEERKPANPNACLSQKFKCGYCNKVCMTPDGLKQHQKFSKRCKLQESRQPRHCPNDYPDWWRQLIASEGTYRE